MYSPQVEVFVKEYHSRQVAVVGAVRAPGLIQLTGAGESILDAITQAGGMTADAADEIVILPQVQGGHSSLQKVAASYEQAPKADAPVRRTAREINPKRRRNPILPMLPPAHLRASRWRRWRRTAATGLRS